VSDHYVFLPGWGFDANIFESIFQKFESAECIGLPQNVSTEMDVIEYLAGKIPDQSIVVAWSLSGLFALEILSLYPNKYRRLIMLGSTPYFSRIEDWRGVSEAFKKSFIENYLTNKAFLKPTFLKQIAYPIRNGQVRNLLEMHCLIGQENISGLFYLHYLFGQDLREIASKYQDKITYLIGDHDAILPQNTVHQLEALGGNVTTIEGAGHVPFLSHEAETVKHLRRQGCE